MRLGSRMVQPFLLRELIENEEALERGLTARMLPFVFEPKRIAEDDGKSARSVKKPKSAWRNSSVRSLTARRMNTEPQKIFWTLDARGDLPSVPQRKCSPPQRKVARH